MPNKEISYEYIRGLIEGEGCFTFCSLGIKDGEKSMIPTFVLGMSKRDEHLVNLVKSRLKIRNKTYKYEQKPLEFIDGKTSYRKPIVKFSIRDIGQIKNIIVPLCYKKLHGNKGFQFDCWINKIGSDARVPSGYKFINKIYKSGFYDNMHEFD